MNQRRQYAATVKDRFGEVGGLPRYLFCNSSTYSEYKRDLLIASQDAVELWNSINRSNVNNIRSSAEFFVAPLHTHCSSWKMDANYVCMQFLSTYCEELIILTLSQQKLDDFFAHLHRFPDWLSMEKLLHASLSANEWIVKSDMTIRKAEWFVNPGHGEVLKRSCERVSGAFVSSIPLFTSTAQVQQAISYGPVTSYKDNVLYVAADNINMVVGDCFMVDNREKYKRVFPYQTSLSPAKAHPFKEVNIRKYVTEMRLRELGYSLHLVYVRGSHLSGDTGLSFVDIAEGATGDLAEDLRDVVMMYVVRAMYP